MVITREYCDRCGKEVESSPLDYKLFPITRKTVKHYMYFRDRTSTRDTTKMVCDDCMKEFVDWWNKKGTRMTI